MVQHNRGLWNRKYPINRTIALRIKIFRTIIQIKRKIEFSEDKKPPTLLNTNKLSAKTVFATIIKPEKTAIKAKKMNGRQYLHHRPFIF